MEAQSPSTLRAWWADRLKDQTLSPLTRDYPDPATDPDRATKRPVDADEVVIASPNAKRAVALLTRHGNASQILLTALAILASRLTGDEDVSIGTSVGSDGKPFVLRVPVAPGEPFLSFLEKVSQATLEGQKRPIPLDLLATHLKRPILFRLAACHTSPSGRNTWTGRDGVDLVINYSASKDVLHELRARYDQRLFSRARISGILAQIFQLIENAAADATLAVGAIDFATPEQQALVPNPTSDLEWSKFRGAIHDIFAANAEAHPNRTCVVETSSEESPKRSFSYQQIHYASNVLAHHLVQSGLERGDVVMVYSHRGVDLVVSVMGILKAGGTFSVLDPAYPPDRQIIYLKVAQPKALIIIDKATSEAGRLSEGVRAYVTEKLELRTEVPALRLQDDGTLLGGKLKDTDVLADVSHLSAKSVGIVVGPDSIPTLSFTSGSEGTPKGVRGRHYSLAFYFDWMAKTFNLSESDRFTMLSGIAHDPIQRDFFTPLFLGAQLLVPSKNDIQNEKLAEWMQNHGATVTHLTPAMGQILVGGASARFEKLHHAFFVGDILIKRDCRSLQSLAPNCFIVNMYGTTETQRAVSYYEIPSLRSRPGFLDGMKDVIPAGRGMYNVQMLVVNRFDPNKLCAVGEIGEIYVRASGLAEGYLAAEDLTKKKFVQNWFPGRETGLELDTVRFQSLKNEPWAKYYRGPRDRLYKSGDLGRYTPSGDVECSGRADDQVKIRGFRIELGEIDTYLSQHALVRENVTLVRRDRFEEHVLVSYVVPQISGWQNFLSQRGLEDKEDDGSLRSRFERFVLLQQDVQDYLKTKLPAYAVPSVIVPMRTMPLNPNGKVDKPRLPFPDTAMLSVARRRRSTAIATLSETEYALAQIWAKIIPDLLARTIKPEESFFDLGGNSMHAQQLPFHIRRTWGGVDIAISRIYSQPQLREMATYIDRVHAENMEGGGDTSKSIDMAKLSSNGAGANARTNLLPSYAEDAAKLVNSLPRTFVSVSEVNGNASNQSRTVFLTGATGFLGAFILRDLFSRTAPHVKVIALVRARNSNDGLQRITATGKAYGVWSDGWTTRLTCLAGSLDQPHFGLEDSEWQRLTREVDVVIHNGARVHWLWPYHDLKPTNVLGTIEAIRLCASGRHKHFTFISSTSVLDTDKFWFKSGRIIDAGGEGISEDDDLSDSQDSLATGYGQSKWAAERLVREAGRRGLRGFIIRPGYILGDSKSGITNTDDFLIRMLKGCIQLRSRPNINNTVNMVPADHVARVVVACAFNPPSSGVQVAHVTGHPRPTFNQFLAALETYGYDVSLKDYVPWTNDLEEYVSRSSSDTGQEFALLSLYAFVSNDLPSNTRAPDLDDRNAEAALYADCDWSGEDVSAGAAVSKNTIGKYLAYLVATGFLPPPSGTSATQRPVKSLPSFAISASQKSALPNVGGRAGAR